MDLDSIPEPKKLQSRLLDWISFILQQGSGLVWVVAFWVFVCLGWNTVKDIEHWLLPGGIFLSFLTIISSYLFFCRKQRREKEFEEERAKLQKQSEKRNTAMTKAIGEIEKSWTELGPELTTDAQKLKWHATGDAVAKFRGDYLLPGNQVDL